MIQSFVETPLTTCENESFVCNNTLGTRRMIVPSMLEQRCCGKKLTRLETGNTSWEEVEAVGMEKLKPSIMASIWGDIQTEVRPSEGKNLHFVCVTRERTTTFGGIVWLEAFDTVYGVTLDSMPHDIAGYSQYVAIWNLTMVNLCLRTKHHCRLVLCRIIWFFPYKNLHNCTNRKIFIKSAYARCTCWNRQGMFVSWQYINLLMFFFYLGQSIKDSQSVNSVSILLRKLFKSFVGGFRW